MRLGLEAIDAVCERLGRPERKVPTVLIAGTNGKGSTAATLSAIAAAAGIRAGLYTSPHLIRVTERLRLEETDVTEEELDASLSRVFEAVDRTPEIPVTYFEALTAAAFSLFSERSLELSILEVGLGGRFDATNVSSPRLSVVTSISLDHTAELGPTVDAIAREKAGVFRPGKPALIASTPEQAREVFREIAARIGAQLHEMSEETSWKVVALSPGPTRFRLETPERSYELCTPLPGAHQAGNASVAVRAAELLGLDFRFDAEAVARGVARVRWPGRLERFDVRGHTVWLDGCHNAEGAESLAEFLTRTALRPDLVLGAMADKDIESIAAAIGRAVEQIRLVPLKTERAATPEELLRRIAAWRPDARISSSPSAALSELLSEPGGKPIIVAGSLYLVGEARELLAGGGFGGRKQ
jgi:dihydrofolate synthase/folylpolyglutamate synthase